MSRINEYRKVIAAILSNLVVLGTAMGLDWLSDIDPSVILSVASILALIVNAFLVERVPNAITKQQRRESQDDPQVHAEDVQDLADTAQDLADEAKPVPIPRKKPTRLKEKIQ